MTKTINAIYEHGVFRPLEPVEDIMENDEVEVTVSSKRGVGHPILKFAGILSEEEADRLMKVVEDEFERINPDEWKD